MFSANSAFLQKSGEEKNKSEVMEELDDLQFQLFRMRENIKEIAKRAEIVGIDYTKEDKWVIVYKEDDGDVVKIMLHDCEAPYKGKWIFSIHAQYKNDYAIHIDDIRGEENRGFGSVCMRFLKEHAMERNIQSITGDIVKRDLNHLDRLVYFYKKHHFHVDLSVDEEKKQGEIVWTPSF